MTTLMLTLTLAAMAVSAGSLNQVEPPSTAEGQAKPVSEWTCIISALVSEAADQLVRII